jgi:hypothetical protein
MQGSEGAQRVAGGCWKFLVTRQMVRCPMIRWRTEVQHFHVGGASFPALGGRSCWDRRIQGVGRFSSVKSSPRKRSKFHFSSTPILSYNRPVACHFLKAQKPTLRSRKQFFSTPTRPNQLTIGARAFTPHSALTPRWTRQANLLQPSPIPPQSHTSPSAPSSSQVRCQAMLTPDCLPALPK